MNRCHFWNRKSISSVSERRRSPQPFSSLPIECLNVCSEQHLMLQSRMMGFQNQGPHHWFPGQFWRHLCPAWFQEPHYWFSVWHGPVTHTGLALSSPHTHCSSQTSRIGFKDSSAPGVLVQQTAAQRDADPEPSWYNAEDRPNKGLLSPGTRCCSRGMVKLHSVNRTFIRSHLSLLLVS